MGKNEKIPKTWTVVHIEDIGANEKYPIGDGDHGQIKPESYVKTGIPYIRVGDMRWGTLSTENMVCIPKKIHDENPKSHLKPGDIIIAKTGATIGKCAIIPSYMKTANTTASVGKVSIDKGLTISKWVLYYFLSDEFKNNMWKVSNKTAQPGFNVINIKKFLIPLAPLNEQKRIVEKIEELFSEIHYSKQFITSVIIKLKNTRESLLMEGIIGNLSKQWRTNYSTIKNNELLNEIKFEQEKYFKKLFENSTKNRRMPKYDVDFHHDVYPKKQIPQDWRWCRLGEIILHLTDYHSNASYELLRKNVSLYDNPDYAFMIRATNFEKNDFANKMKYISKNAYEFLFKSKLFGGEILIGKIGNAGAVYFMPTLNHPSSLAMNLFALRFPKQINSKYVYYHLTSSSSKQNIQKYVKGVGNPTIDKKSIRSLWISLPSFDEQNFIVKILETYFTIIDTQISGLTSILKKHDILFSSILKKAFEGKLVPQDPNDEPVSELLKQIKNQ